MSLSSYTEFKLQKDESLRNLMACESSVSILPLVAIENEKDFASDQSISSRQERVKFQWHSLTFQTRGWRVVKSMIC